VGDLSLRYQHNQNETKINETKQTLRVRVERKIVVMSLILAAVESQRAIRRDKELGGYVPKTAPAIKACSGVLEGQDDHSLRANQRNGVWNWQYLSIFAPKFRPLCSNLLGAAPPAFELASFVLDMPTSYLVTGDVVCDYRDGYFQVNRPVGKEFAFTLPDQRDMLANLLYSATDAFLVGRSVDCRTAAARDLCDHCTAQHFERVVDAPGVTLSAAFVRDKQAMLHRGVGSDYVIATDVPGECVQLPGVLGTAFGRGYELDGSTTLFDSVAVVGGRLGLPPLSKQVYQALLPVGSQYLVGGAVVDAYHRPVILLALGVLDVRVVGGQAVDSLTVASMSRVCVQEYARKKLRVDLAGAFRGTWTFSEAQLCILGLPDSTQFDELGKLLQAQAGPTSLGPVGYSKVWLCDGSDEVASLTLKVPKCGLVLAALGKPSPREWEPGALFESMGLCDGFVRLVPGTSVVVAPSVARVVSDRGAAFRGFWVAQTGLYGSGTCSSLLRGKGLTSPYASVDELLCEVGRHVHLLSVVRGPRDDVGIQCGCEVESDDGDDSDASDG
jgi:hypothetical protein